MDLSISKKYQKLTPIEHILKRPGMYIGGVEDVDNTVWVLNNNKQMQVPMRQHM